MKKQKMFGISFERSELTRGDKLIILLEKPIPKMGYSTKEIIILLKKYGKMCKKK
jgi:hypothetical protein